MNITFRFVNRYEKFVFRIFSGGEDVFKLNKEKVFLLRAEKGLKVAELAELAGVSRREVSANKRIGALSAGKIANALGVNVEEIVIRVD